MNTTRFSAVFGVVAGYQGEQCLLEAEHHSLQEIGSVWQEAANKVQKETGIYISGIVHSSAALYHVDWGCPIGGEPTYTIVGSRNPKFCKNENAWKQSALKVINLVKEHYNQVTVTVEFWSVDQIYLT